MMAALAVLGYKWHKARRKAQAEVAFDAALQDSGLGLDDAFEQVSPSQENHSCQCRATVTMLWLLMLDLLAPDLPIVVDVQCPLMLLCKPKAIACTYRRAFERYDTSSGATDI